MERHFFSGGLKEKNKVRNTFSIIFKNNVHKRESDYKREKIKTLYFKIIIAGCSFTVIMLNVTEV